MEITKNALENMMLTYIEHKKTMIEYEKNYDTENTEYYYHMGCCETAESWLGAIGVSPQCNFIMEKLYA